jgi:hypothetical protein
MWIKFLAYKSEIFSFICGLNTLPVTEGYTELNGRNLVSNKLAKAWKELAVTYLG